MPWWAFLTVENQLRYSTPNTKKRCQNDVFQSLQKIFLSDRPNFTTESDVELSGLSKDMNIVSIGREPAELLNAKPDARRFNAFPMSRYSKYSRNWWFLGWYSKEQQHRVEHVTEMDVEFNCLSNDNTSIFGGWEPAAVFNAKHDATEKTVPKRRVLNSPKNETNIQASIYYQTGCWIQLPI